jgi:colanic acid biosynthesis glycosyl transferase WcaI
MARHLARDHDVAVLTGLPHYPAWEVPTNYRRLQFEEELDGVRVLRRAYFVPPHHSALLRTLHEGTLLLSGQAASIKVWG